MNKLNLSLCCLVFSITIYGCQNTRMRVHNADNYFQTIQNHEAIVSFDLTATGDSIQIIQVPSDNNPASYKRVEASSNNEQLLQYTKQLIEKLAQLAAYAP